MRLDLAEAMRCPESIAINGPSRNEGGRHFPVAEHHPECCVSVAAHDAGEIGKRI